MYDYNTELLQNYNTEPNLSSITVFVSVMIFGVFFATKNKKNNKPLYTRLIPEFITYGFVNFQKISFGQKPEANLPDIKKLKTKITSETQKTK